MNPRPKTRLEELQRLRSLVELEIRQERARLKANGRDRKRRDYGSPPTHGTEADYQAESRLYRLGRGPKPCDVCTTAHALHNRERYAERVAAGLPGRRRRDNEEESA